MSRVALYQSDFTAGELSPKVEGRTDIKKYKSGCRTLQNMFVHVHGGATRRPGLKYVAEVKNSAHNARLIPFKFNPDYNYILELGDKYMRFYRSHSTVMSGAVPYEIVTPYSHTELGEIKTEKIGQYLYFVHPSHLPYRLERDSDVSQTLSAVSFTNIPPDFASTPPRAIAYYEQRAFYGGENRIYASVSQLPDDMTSGVADDDAFIYDTSADMIYWFVSGRKLIVGDWGQEWAMSSGSDDLAMTPTKAKIRSDSNQGSADIQGIKVKNAVLLVQRALRKVLQIAYDFATDNFNTDDISVLSEHITETGIKNWAYQGQPDSIVWMLRNDGKLIGLTYDQSQAVLAWHRHETGSWSNGLTGYDCFESVAVIPDYQDPLDVPWDEPWFIVNRNIGGSEKRFVEYLMGDFGNEISDAFYVDCGLSHDVHFDIIGITSATPTMVTTDSSTTFIPGNRMKFTDLESSSASVLNNRFYSILSTPTSVTFNIDCDFSTGTYDSGGTARKAITVAENLDHLAGETVSVLVDGAVQVDKIVSAGGTITIDPEGCRVHAGLPYTSILEPMRADGGSQDGTSQGKRGRIQDIMIRFFNTLGANVGSASDHMDIVSFRRPSDPMDQPPPLFNGDKVLPFNGGWDTNKYIRITQEQPLPMTVLSISPRMEVND